MLKVHHTTSTTKGKKGKEKSKQTGFQIPFPCPPKPSKRLANEALAKCEIPV
jgi:hypothetical protein